ncbi:MAG: hypothetical protein GXO97_08405, partial [Nitrospirae bacterium]|nr:hypothetical protein [Nitrospirota bacterium]
MKRIIIFFLLLIPLLFSYTYAKEVSKMVENIHWLGHDTFKITGKDVT